MYFNILNSRAVSATGCPFRRASMTEKFTGASPKTNSFSRPAPLDCSMVLLSCRSCFDVSEFRLRDKVGILEWIVWSATVDFLCPCFLFFPTLFGLTRLLTQGRVAHAS